MEQAKQEVTEGFDPQYEGYEEFIIRLSAARAALEAANEWGSHTNQLHEADKRFFQAGCLQDAIEFGEFMSKRSSSKGIEVKKLEVKHLKSKFGELYFETDPVQQKNNETTDKTSGKLQVRLCKTERRAHHDPIVIAPKRQPDTS